MGPDGDPGRLGKEEAMAEQKYRCIVCGAIVTPNPDGTCPVCGAPREMLVPVDENGNDIEG